MNPLKVCSVLHLPVSLFAALVPLQLAKVTVTTLWLQVLLNFTVWRTQILHDSHLMLAPETRLAKWVFP